MTKDLHLEETRIKETKEFIKKNLRFPRNLKKLKNEVDGERWKEAVLRRYITRNKLSEEMLAFLKEEVLKNKELLTQNNNELLEQKLYYFVFTNNRLPLKFKEDDSLESKLYFLMDENFPVKFFRSLTNGNDDVYLLEKLKEFVKEYNRQPGVVYGEAELKFYRNIDTRFPKEVLNKIKPYPHFSTLTKHKQTLELEDIKIGSVEYSGLYHYILFVEEKKDISESVSLLLKEVKYLFNQISERAQAQERQKLLLRKDELIKFVETYERLPSSRDRRNLQNFLYTYKERPGFEDLQKIYNYYISDKSKNTLIKYLKENNSIPPKGTAVRKKLKYYIDEKDPRIMDLLKKLNVPTFI